LRVTIYCDRTPKVSGNLFLWASQLAVTLIPPKVDSVGFCYPAAANRQFTLLRRYEPTKPSNYKKTEAS